MASDLESIQYLSFYQIFACLYLTELQVILFEIDWASFYTNLHDFFVKFISSTNWVNYCKFMDNCGISRQVMANMGNILQRSHNY